MKPDSSLLALIQTHPVVFVTRDLERALGLLPTTPTDTPTPENPSPNAAAPFPYYIITNSTAFGEKIKSWYPNTIFLIPSTGDMLDTDALLEHPLTATTIASRIASPLKPHIVVFKNTKRIEKIVHEKGWALLNPSAALTETIENKLTQNAWLAETIPAISDIMLPAEIKTIENIVWNKTPLIVQWGHSHTGDGTLLINTKAELDTLSTTFGKREARITPYHPGPVYTLNVAIDTVGTIYTGNVNYQITGLAPFTDHPWSTVGNDWSLPYSALSPQQLHTINTMANTIAQRLGAAGWKGLFGIDILYAHERGQLFVLEINARQPASTTYESQLQALYRGHGVRGLTSFEAHLLCLLGTLPAKAEAVVINDGAQIIVRTDKTQALTVPARQSLAAILETFHYNTIVYENTGYNSDAVRIHSHQGLLESHHKLNARGKAVAEMVEHIVSIV